MKWFVISLVSFLFCWPQTFARADVENHSTQHISLFHIDPLTDGSIVAFSAAGILWANYNADHLIRTRCPCDREEVIPFDRGVIGNRSAGAGLASDISVGAAVLFPIVLDWFDIGWSKGFTEDMSVFAETLAVNGGLVTLAKYSVQRPLPRTYEGDPELVNNARGYRAFYSGHTSVAVSALTTGAYTYAARHPGVWWPWAVTGIIGTSVALERVADGRHFYSDVIVGGAMGAAVGMAVPALHRRKGENSNKQNVAFYPVNDGGLFIWSAGF